MTSAQAAAHDEGRRSGRIVAYRPIPPGGPMNVTELVTAARGQIQNLSVDEVAAELDDPQVVLVDVRERAEIASDGAIPGAVAAPRGMLEFHADPSSPYHVADLQPDRRVILYCKTGGRSALAAVTLTGMGYRKVAHLDGGIAAWTTAQRPTT
jgi:rhodanese-related sulfurtransferase